MEEEVARTEVEVIVDDKNGWVDPAETEGVVYNIDDPIISIEVKEAIAEVYG